MSWMMTKVSAMRSMMTHDDADTMKTKSELSPFLPVSWQRGDVMGSKKP